tara:strand:- start:6035 stop:6406 length:372 start_codon:yes stop_codon:yes gene_type:complete
LLEALEEFVRAFAKLTSQCAFDVSIGKLPNVILQALKRLDDVRWENVWAAAHDLPDLYVGRAKISQKTAKPVGLPALPRCLWAKGQKHAQPANEPNEGVKKNCEADAKASPKKAEETHQIGYF